MKTQEVGLTKLPCMIKGRIVPTMASHSRELGNKDSARHLEVRSMIQLQSKYNDPELSCGDISIPSAENLQLLLAGKCL